MSIVAPSDEEDIQVTELRRIITLAITHPRHQLTSLVLGEWFHELAESAYDCPVTIFDEKIYSFQSTI
jgi:hypothetical protein